MKNPFWYFQRWWDLEHPVWLCGFRSFFAASLVYATVAMAAWLLVAVAGVSLPLTGAAGALAWHVHELVLGLGVAAALGFLLTAVPEFTATARVSARTVRRLLLWWLAARAAVAVLWGAGEAVQPWALAAAAALHAVLLGDALWVLTPRLWTQAQRRHASFIAALLALLAATLGLYTALWAADMQAAWRWLHGVMAVFMALIVLALSRISMSIVNAQLERHNVRESDGQLRLYLARPARRNLALVCIAAHALAVVLQAAPSTQGWLAAATAAAVLALMGDWHIGRALLARWPLMLYAVYVCMAAGYGLIAAAALQWWSWPEAAGWHALGVGAFGLNILVVIWIAGYTHSGIDKDENTWIPFSALSLVLAVIFRIMAYGFLNLIFLSLAGGFWIIAFGLSAWHMLPVLLGPRRDGKTADQGCDGV